MYLRVLFDAVVEEVDLVSLRSDTALRPFVQCDGSGSVLAALISSCAVVADGLQDRDRGSPMQTTQYCHSRFYCSFGL